MTDLKSGDVVRLRSGGADMTVQVTRITECAGLYLGQLKTPLLIGDIAVGCNWHTESGEQQEKVYLAEMLKRVDRCDVCSNIDKSGDYWKCTTNDEKGPCHVMFTATSDSDKRKLECYYEPSRFVRKDD
jgi:uncharacterized protein YodC (DUF2158 family)